MWENSQREKELVEEIYHIRDEKNRLEVERIESGGKAEEFKNRRSADIVAIIVFSAIFVVVAVLTLGYYAVSFGMYDMATALMWATGLFATFWISLIAVIVVILRYFILNGKATFWLKVAEKLNVENRYAYYLRDADIHRMNLLQYNRMCRLLEEREQELERERNRNSYVPQGKRELDPKTELIGADAGKYFQQFFKEDGSLQNEEVTKNEEVIKKEESTERN